MDLKKGTGLLQTLRWYNKPQKAWIWSFWGICKRQRNDEFKKTYLNIKSQLICHKIVRKLQWQFKKYTDLPWQAPNLLWITLNRIEGCESEWGELWICLLCPQAEPTRSHRRSRKITENIGLLIKSGLGGHSERFYRCLHRQKYGNHIPERSGYRA